MAKILYTAIVNEIKGSILGTTFQQNKSGTIIRGKPSAKHISNNNQSSNQQLNNYINKLWNELSLDNKLEWNDFADLYEKTNKFNELKNLTGFNWFYSINRYRLLFSQSLFTTPPTYTLPDSIPDYSLRLYENNIKIEFAESFEAGETFLIIFSTPPTSQSLTNNRGLCRLTQIDSTGVYDVIDITDMWQSVHGINYPPGDSSDKFYVHSLIVSVSSISGISISGLSKSAEYYYNVCGIGCMVIGSTFIVY